LAKKVTEAHFVISSSQLSQCPKPDRPEYAFIGRSNVGKSSLINMITGQPGMAKTSQTPGKTQLINHFLVNEHWYLVDLPGYGYARVSKKDRDMFETMIMTYLLERPSLICTFVLLDLRLPPQKIDLAFMAQLGQYGLPFAIVYTKADKLSKTLQEKNLELYQNTLLETWEVLPASFMSSSTSGMGKTEILAYIKDLHQHFKP
jgi:GTP-binding protein